MKSFNTVIVALIAFMGYIIFLVIGTMRTNVDLEYVDYYQKEIEYQGQIDAQKNTENLKKQPLTYIDKEVVYVEVPEGSDFQQGVVNIYRTSNSEDDFSTNLSVPVSEISLAGKPKGLYRVEVSWIDSGKHYFYKTEVNL